MKATKNVFERKEKKYVLSHDKARAFLDMLSDHMEPDFYYESHIKSTYYDDDDYSIIEHSISKPKFKQKLRVRSYGTGTLFVELKKKYDGIVYKRRVEMIPEAALAWVNGEMSFEKAVETYGTPKGKEIDYAAEMVSREINAYLARHVGMTPAMDVYAHRYSYREVGDEDGIRITMDATINYDDLRDEKRSRDDEAVLLTPDVVMEIKVPEAYPLWLVAALSELDIYPSSFSKYGNAYKIIRKERLMADWHETADEVKITTSMSKEVTS